MFYREKFTKKFNKNVNNDHNESLLEWPIRALRGNLNLGITMTRESIYDECISTCQFKINFPKQIKILKYQIC